MNNAIKAANTDFVENFPGELNANESDPKRFWRYIKYVLPEHVNGMIDIKNPLTKTALPRDSQAQVINDFFAGIGQNLARKFERRHAVNMGNEELGDKLALRHILYTLGIAL